MRPRRLSMGWTVAVVAVIALALASGAALVIAHVSFGWPWFTTLAPDGQTGGPNFLDALRLGLTVGAGFGGAVALVVAYRRQGIHERQEPRERYGAAVAQLGSENTVARLAGVYALANLADEWQEQRQQCVDVLCAYLRMPWEHTPDAEHPLAARTISTTVSHEPDETRTYTYRDATGEAEVRKTILRVIADHLRLTNLADQRRRIREGSWSYLRLDFTAAILPDTNMSDCIMPDMTSFDGATFVGDARFGRALFIGDARFGGARFVGDARFGGVTFAGDAWFNEVTFAGDAWFNEMFFFGDARFGQATFARDAWFAKATFTGDALFDLATFTGGALLNQTTSTGDAWISRDDLRFAGATFKGQVSEEIRRLLTVEQLAQLDSGLADRE
ncbi:MAG: pentapeptide repeat-containing protein [Dermatophilaceae bacterium]